MNRSSVLFSTIMSAILLWHSRRRKLSNYMKPGSRSAECWDTQLIKLIISCHPAKWYRSITLVCCMDDRLSGSLKNPRAFCKGCTLTGISFIHEWGFWPNILTFHLESENNIQLFPEGEVNSAAFILRREASRYISSAMNRPWGDSCCSIYQISWIKIKKELFVNKRRHFVWVCLRTFQLTVFWGSFFLTILLQIQRENFFPPTSKQRQAKFCLLLGIFWHSYFSYR